MKDWTDAPFFARIELNHLWRLVFKNQEMLKNAGLLGKKPPKPLEGGTGGAKYWDELLRRDSPSITAKMALGSWQTGYDSYSQHYLKYINPHSSHPQWTVGVKTPLVDSAANLNLLPASGSQVTIADTGGGGTHRPVVIADQAYQTRSSEEAFKLYVVPTLGVTEQIIANIAARISNTDDSKRLTLLSVGMGLDGTDVLASNSQVFQASLTFDGSAAQPAVSNQPLSLTDWHIHFLENFTGSVPKVVGIYADLLYHASATGTCTDFYFITGAASLGVSGKITNFAWLNLPNVANATNFYHMMLGAGTILAEGDIVWESSAAARVPLALRGAASQSGNLLEFQNDTPANLAVIDYRGWYGIGQAPTQMIDLAAETSAANVSVARYGDTYSGQMVLKQARGTIASPSATQSADRIGQFYAQGYGATAFKVGAYIRWAASENWTDAATGTDIEFRRCKTGTTAASVALKLNAAGQATFQGGVGFAVTSKSADYTATGSDFLLLVTTGATNKQLYLPAVAGVSGRVYVIKKMDGGAGNVVINPNGAEQVDGAGTLTLAAQYDYAVVAAGPSEWARIG